MNEQGTAIIDQESFDGSVRSILAEVDVLTLATVSPEGPWAADVFFAADEFRLYFWSSPSSRHCLDLGQVPRCAATIHPVVRSWQTITGLQLTGTTARASDTDRAAQTYLAKYPFAKPLINGASARSAVPWELRVTRIRLIDNTLGFGQSLSAEVEDGRLGDPSPDREMQEATDERQ
ncbi:MAG: pyridoxamine 5'-phosphate oxidase family protein [Actinobacteria bacterium]|nr:pyridoxamine 5'-phosphate oxidase family protein [Actinomycetota bacterium]